MPISFLNPSLLFGAMAAALPVIIHFLSRRRVRRQQFSDLRFLDEVRSRQARSLGLRRWLLLLLRVLAILCVVLAVAGPRWGGLGPGGGTRSVLFVIDNSASMSTAQDSGTRLEEAISACGEMMRSLPVDAAVQVLVAGSRTRPLFGDWLPVGAGAIGGLSLVEPTDGAFDLERVFAEAARLVARAPGLPVQIVLLSDLQEVPLAAAESAGARRLREVGETHLLVRRIGEPTAGGGVLAIMLPDRAVRPGESVTLRARVKPQFGEQVFVLELDGRLLAEVVTHGQVGETEVLEFPLTVPATGRHLGVIRKETDAFARDDSRPFVLEVPDHLDILLVHGQDQPLDGVAGRGGWRYLAEALDPGQTGSPFRTRVLPSAELTTGATTAADVVYLVDPDPLGRRALDGLLDWVSTGGQVVVLAGDPKLTGYLNSTLLPAAGLSGQVGFAAVAAPGQHSQIVAGNHPVFNGLDAAALKTFEDVTWRRWFRLNEGAGRVLVALVGDDPLLMESTHDAGRFVFVASDLQPVNSDLAGSPMALPFFRRLTAWLARGRSASALNIQVGSEPLLPVLGPRARSVLDRTGELRVRSTTGETTDAAAVVWDRGEPRLRGGSVDRAGYVTFLAGSDTIGVVAAAVPASESELKLRTPEEFAAVLAGFDLTLAADLSTADPAGFMAVLGGHDLTGWLLAAALLLLAIELGVGRGTHR